MFGGPPPEQSPQEIEAQELKAQYDIQVTVLGCVGLYLSPFVIDFVRKLF